MNLTHATTISTNVFMREHPAELLVRRACLLMMVSFLISYMFLVSLSTVHTIARKEALRDVATIESKIATLEQEAMALRGRVNEHTGPALGLSHIGTPHFVSRTVPLGLVR